MTYGFVSSSMTEKQATFSGSQSHSLETEATPEKQIYQVTVPSGKQLYSGTVYVSINGSFLSSHPSNQTTVTTAYDFYISSSTAGKIAINKPYTDGVGITLEASDDVVIKYVLSVG
jgi:hypothetical protein